MLQLGAKQVLRHVPSESYALEEIQTKVLKVLVYQDEWVGGWVECFCATSSQSHFRPQHHARFGSSPD